MPLVLLVDSGVVSEGEHSESRAPSQTRKSDNGNP